MGLNQYSELLNYLKSLADADVFINTVTKGKWDKMETFKNVKFPQCHIFIGGGGFNNGSTLLFNVQIGVFDIRDFSKEISTDIFWGQDNEDDNINETLASLNRMWLIMLTDFEKTNITTTENPTFEFGTFEYANVLDGAILSMDIEVPNTTINLCD